MHEGQTRLSSDTAFETKLGILKCKFGFWVRADSVSAGCVAGVGETLELTADEEGGGGEEVGFFEGVPGLVRIGEDF